MTSPVLAVDAARALLRANRSIRRQLTKIPWADITFNPWWGCVKIDRECTSCYAATFALRVGQKVWGNDVDRRLFGDDHWAGPVKWNRLAAAARTPLMVFCASMADLFEIHPDPAVQAELDAARARLFALIEATPWLIWQLLTKRPENVNAMVPAHWVRDGWPANVWLGTSAGRTVIGQGTGPNLPAKRIDALVATGARTKFVSVEPMVGQVDLARWLPQLDWVIFGGESGGAKVARMDPAWARDLVAQCQAAGVPVFAKQTGTKLAKEWALPTRTGDDPALWPPEWADLRPRQFPAALYELAA